MVRKRKGLNGGVTVQDDIEGDKGKNGNNTSCRKRKKSVNGEDMSGKSSLGKVSLKVLKKKMKSASKPLDLLSPNPNSTESTRNQNPNSTKSMATLPNPQVTVIPPAPQPTPLPGLPTQPPNAEAALQPNMAQRRVSRFEVRAGSAIPQHQHDPTLETAIFTAAANFPMTRLTYPAISTYVPCASVLMACVNQMDTIMASTSNWTSNCMGWVPPYSQLYFGMLFYIHVLRAMRIAGHLNSELFGLLKHFEMLYPFSSLPIPGPLVSFFNNLACFSPDDNQRFGIVTPAIPFTPGWCREYTYTFNDFNTHLPHLSVFLSRLYSTCAAATRNGTDEFTFANDVDGPRYMATLFSQLCDNQWASEHNILRSPGASLAYAGDLRLWRNAALNLPNIQLPPNLDVDIAEVDDCWTSVLRLDNSFNWFSSVAAMMSRYCKFWKGSSSFEDCSPCGSSAGAIRCSVNTLSTTLFNIPKWNRQAGNGMSDIHGNINQIGHYTLLNSPTIMFDAYTALVDIPDVYVHAALTYSYNLHIGSQRCVSGTGPFWKISPEAARAIRVSTFQGVVASLARIYHSDSCMDKDSR